MTPNTRLRPALEERLEGLAALPAEHYLAAGRAAARRRRRTTGGIALAVGGVVAATVASVALWAPPLAHGPSGPATTAEQPDRPVVEREPAVSSRATAPSISSVTVAQGLGDIEAFSTARIPEWAQEYGNHGPVAIAPDGRLWVAPEATVLRTVQDPLAVLGDGRGDTVSYAVEVRWETDRPGLTDADGLAWSFLSRSSGSSLAGGTLDVPGRWTVDLGLWAEDQALGTLGRPGFAEQLVGFADSTSDRLVPGRGVELVRQVADVDRGELEEVARATAAEVRVAGQTWFVMGNGPRRGEPWYEAYDPASVGASDLEGFLAFVRRGFEPADAT